MRRKSLSLPGSATPATTNHNSFVTVESGEAAESSETWVWE
jgi:hypothetical protein